MKHRIIAAGLLALCGTNAAYADQAPAAASLSFNGAITGDYRYRGISQTRLRPAVQGGVDLVHAPTGLYAGAWASTIRWTRDAGGGGSVEVDLVAGRRMQFGPSGKVDVGVLRYLYPSNDLAKLPGFANAHTTELFGQLSWGGAQLKYSHATGNLFGFPNTKGSGYLDLGTSFDAGRGFTIDLHAGRQRVRNNPAASYTDWKLGASRDLGYATGSLAYVGTNASKLVYASPANGKFLGRSGLVLTLSRTF